MSVRHIEQQNRPILSWPTSHSARRFLDAFIACQKTCVGREIAYKNSPQTAVDLEWASKIDGRVWRFSEFAYVHLSFTVVLDGWLSGSPELTESEKRALNQIPHLRTLMAECHSAAVAQGNSTITGLADEVQRMLELWETCIRSRMGAM